MLIYRVEHRDHMVGPYIARYYIDDYANYLKFISEHLLKDHHIPFVYNGKVYEPERNEFYGFKDISQLKNWLCDDAIKGLIHFNFHLAKVRIDKRFTKEDKNQVIFNLNYVKWIGYVDLDKACGWC